jgi:hypothetical protein
MKLYGFLARNEVVACPAICCAMWAVLMFAAGLAVPCEAQDNINLGGYDQEQSDGDQRNHQADSGQPLIDGDVGENK